MARQVALLRGINLGARQRVAMPALRELLTELGYGDVRTLLQSGNVVLTSPASPDRLQRELERHIAGRLGVDAQVLVRTRDELADVIERNPLASVADDPRRQQVSFLSAALEPAVARELAKADVAPEQVVVGSREIYAWHPRGLQRSALAKLLTDRRLGVTVTARNWSTVTKLLALADE
jgi:uncharacterized protein (DUF1697 family)